MSNLKDVLDKAKGFKENPPIAQAKAFIELSNLLERVIKAIEEVKNEPTVNAQFLKDNPIQVENKFGGLRESIDAIIPAIKGIKETRIKGSFPLKDLKKAISAIIPTIKSIKGVDMSGVESLLSQIVNKKDKPQKPIDLRKLNSISNILGEILRATKKLSKVEQKEQKDNSKGVIKAIKDVYDIIDTLNENIVKTDFGFDYQRLENIVRKIKVTGGVVGGGPGIVALKFKDGTENKEVSTDNPLPVDATFTGTLEVHLDKNNDSVEVFQATHDNLNGNANIQVGNTDVSGANPVPVSGPLTNTELRATPLPVSLESGDIEIGAVEIKDADSGTRLDIESSGTRNAAFVQSETLATAAKQLPDNHQVTVSNQIDQPIEEGGTVVANKGTGWVDPQTDALTDAELRATPVPVDTGLVQPTTPADTQPISAVSLPLPTGAATAANQQTDALTDAELRATPVSVSLASTTITGTVAVTQSTSPWVVSATDLDIRDLAFATDKVDVTGSSVSVSSSALPAGAATAANQQTDALTDTELRAAPVPVSATDLDIRNLTFATDKVDVSGSTGVGVTGPLTDTQLRATAVPVSGPLTDTQLRATPVPISGTVAATQSGTWTEANSAAIKTSVEIMDDWDESDRAKVNPIAGQAGVQGGSGTVNALTQRMVLATDVALPTGSNQIGATVAQRPSQGTGRTYKTAVLSNQTADALLYTVTASKTLYVKTMSIFVFNTSTTNSGVLELKDGTTAAGTTRYAALMSAAGVGAVTAASAVSHVLVTFQEPFQFTTGMFLDITVGTLTFSAFMNGYEE